MADAVPRRLPADMADRLIVALDVPGIDQARAMVARLDGIVSFYKVGLWLAFARGVDGLLGELAATGKRVFLDTKMFDISQTVEEGVARAAERGVDFVTVHGDAQIIKAAMRGKRGRELKIFAVTVLTSLNDADLYGLGYRMGVQDLVQLRARQAVEHGCDGIIASASDDPNALRRLAGSDELLIATPGVRPAGASADDQRRIATPGQAIANGADYLVVGRPIIAAADPAASARAIIAEMTAAAG